MRRDPERQQRTIKHGIADVNHRQRATREPSTGPSLPSGLS
jgi:hypothetical protein